MAPTDVNVPFRVRPRVRHPKTLPAFDVQSMVAALEAPDSSPPTAEEAASPSQPPRASSPPPRLSLADLPPSAPEAFFEVEGLIGGRFHLEERLDDGDTTQVWSAFDSFVGREVLVAIGEDAAAGDAIRGFAGVRSPDVLAACASCEADGERFVALPRVHGETLAERLSRDGRLPPAECAHLLATVVEGLAAIHDRGLVHGAIDAQSVFLVRPAEPGEVPRAVLIAPGLSHVVAAGSAAAATMPPSLRAPEQIEAAGEPDARTDLYAVAGVLYLALTGRQPFVGRTPAELQQHVLSASFDPPSKLRRSLPPPVDAFFRRAFAVDPARRFGSARELGAVFRMVVDDDTRAGSTPPPSPRAPEALPVRIGRALRFSAVAAVIAAIAVVALWQLLHREPDVEASSAPALVR